MNHVPAAGFTLLELLLALALVATMVGVGVPMVSTALDEIRTMMAARYLEARIMDARLHAVRRSARVALRFEPAGADYRFAEYLDGNGNGIRATDIASAVDVELAPRQSLHERFPGVTFGLRPDIPDLDDGRAMGGSDGVRIGSSRILTLGPDGTATPGTLYIRGVRGQYAVRVLGATGRTRVLRFDSGTQQWIAR